MVTTYGYTQKGSTYLSISVKDEAGNTMPVIEFCSSIEGSFNGTGNFSNTEIPASWINHRQALPIKKFQPNEPGVKGTFKPLPSHHQIHGKHKGKTKRW